MADPKPLHYDFADGIRRKARYWRCGECGHKWKVMTEAEN